MPLYYNYKSSGRPVAPGIWFARRYIDIPHRPIFPFGYGLSYTQFAYSNLALSSTEMRQSIDITAEITNTGSRAGIEVVQLYVRDLIGEVTRPVKELKDFQRIQLQPGETRLVHFRLEAKRWHTTGWMIRISYLPKNQLL